VLDRLFEVELSQCISGHSEKMCGVECEVVFYCSIVPKRGPV
jgi:hypothetical protein